VFKVQDTQLQLGLQNGVPPEHFALFGFDPHEYAEQVASQQPEAEQDLHASLKQLHEPTVPEQAGL
jgi:hypothetical protein